MYTYEYPMPMITVDLVVIAGTDQQLLLVERKHFPHVGKWALPGGFMNIDERIRDAAVRELQEETHLTVDPFKLNPVGVYDNPSRDPRGRVISHAFMYNCGIKIPEATADDDAAKAVWYSYADYQKLFEDGQIAFDHTDIIYKAIGWGRRCTV